MLSFPLTVTASSSEPTELRQLLYRAIEMLTAKQGVIMHETAQANNELTHNNDAVIIILLLPLPNNDEAQEPLFFECFDNKSVGIKGAEVYPDDKSQEKVHPAEKGR